MGWILSDTTEITATNGVIFTGADIGLPAQPGRFEVIAQNIAPLDPTIAGEASIRIGAIASEPIGVEVPDGILSIWVIWEQQQSPPGTPVAPGDLYQWNGIGNTVPEDSGGYSHVDPWDTTEFSVDLVGTGPYDPTGDTFTVTCRLYTWVADIKTMWEALPFESGDPGDPGYLYNVDSATASDGDVDKRLIQLDWVYSNPGEQDGFGVFAPDDEWYPIAPDALAGEDQRSYAFTREFPRNAELTFFVQAYNASKRSSELTPAVAPVVNVELSPDPGIMPIGSVGNPYLLQFTASNGVTDDIAYTYAVTAGALPDGLTLDPDTGIVSGTPTLQGDYFFEITASSVDVADSIPTGSWEINIQLSTPLWSMTPPSGNVEPGETITIEGPEGDFVATDENGNTAPLKGPTYEVPYPPTDECLDCLDDCPECQDCATACAQDINSAACQECMQACLDCLTDCLEDLLDAEDCQDTLPGSTVTVHGGRQFGGTVPLGTLTVITTEASGIYKFTIGKKNDTIYRAARDGTTYDVKIPNPGGQTGFFRA